MKGYTLLGVGIVMKSSTTAEQNGLLEDECQSRAIYRVRWQNRTFLPAFTGWLFAHQLVSATKEKQLPKQ